MKWYTLNDKKEVVTCSLEEANECDRRVKQEDVGDLWVSTVFLMMDHAYPFPHNEDDADYKPLIFETMIRNTATDEWEDYQERYYTYNEALTGHNAVVEKLKQGLPLDEEEIQQ